MRHLVKIVRLFERGASKSDKLRHFRTILLTGLFAIVGSSVTATAQSYAYVPNGAIGTLSIIDTGTNSVVATLSGGNPLGVAITPNGSFAYVTNFSPGTVWIIDRTNSIVATLSGFSRPFFLAACPNGRCVYVANNGN